MKFICLTILLATGGALRAQPRLIPFETDGRWGYQTLEGTVVIPARYELAQEFTDGGIAAVADKKGWAYIDTAGKTVIRPYIFDNGPDYFRDGLARFAAKGKFGFFNTRGEKVIAPQFDFAAPFAEGRAAVCKGGKQVAKGEHSAWEGGRWGYIDTAGKQVIPCIYEQARPFAANVAEVMKDGAWLRIDKKGQPVVLPKTDAVTKATPRAPQPGSKPEVPVQEITGGPEATAEYMQAARDEFMICLHPVFLEVATATIRGKDNPLDRITQKALACHERYFNTMKGGSVITQEDVKEALAWLAERYVRLGAALLNLKAQFKKAGADFTLQEPDYFDGTTLWKTGLVPGVPVRTGDNTVLYAYPLIPAVTDAYLVPAARPPAAYVTVCNDDLMFLAGPQAPLGAKAGEVMETAAGTPKDITEKVPDAHLGRQYRAFLDLALVKAKTYEQIEALREHYKVAAVVTGDPHAFTAVIHTGKEDRIPKLVREFMQ